MLPFRRFPLSRILPSCWIVAWFLLLLGFCTSLFPGVEIRSSSGIQWPVHEGGLCTGGIIEMHVPPLRPITATIHFAQGLPYLSLNELGKARCWQTISFTGNGINDFSNLDAMQQYLQSLGGKDWHTAGIRIIFGHKASYACFAEVLSILSVWGDHKYYWLDVRHKHLTVYVVVRPLEIILNQ